MKEPEIKTDALNLPLVRQWAEQQYNTNKAKAAELKPLHQSRKREANILYFIGVGFLIASIPTPHPADYILTGGTWLFWIIGAVKLALGMKTESEYQDAKWRSEVSEMGLRIANTIQLEDQTRAKVAAGNINEVNKEQSK